MLIITSATSRLRWVSAALTGGVLLAVAALGAQTSVRLETTLDENWRGRYDILVTSRDQDFGAARTNGMVDPNFVATAGTGGVSVDDLARIRGIDGVEVAAPIGMVGSLRRLALSPALWVSDDPATGTSVVPDGGLVAQLTATTVLPGSDGDDEVVVARGSGRVRLQKRAAADLGTLRDTAYGDGRPQGFAPVWIDTGFVVPLGALPGFGSTVVAVDPVAEAALLGPEGGAFLAPLVGLPADRSASTKWADLVKGDSFLKPRADIDVAARRSADQAPVVPMVVNSEPARKLTVRVDIALAKRTFTAAELADPGLLESLTASDFSSPRSVRGDVSSALVPFSSPDLTLLWPGSTRPDDDGAMSLSQPVTSLAPMLIGRPDYTAKTPPGGGAGFQVVPAGIVRADGSSEADPQAVANGMDPKAGRVRAYRSADAAGAASGALPAPLGVYTTADLNDPSSQQASYVPLGVSSADGTWRTSSTDKREPVAANLSNVDFITAAPGAFTDLEGGRTLRGQTPIDAVRVRVGGITGYTAQAQQRIAAIAGQIQALGLSATIVAGSSPQPVSLFVPDYFPDRSGDAADLGWVSQEWTTLGAAARVGAALTGTTLLLAILALASNAAGLAIVAHSSARRLRPNVEGLRRIGWRRGRVLRQLLEELALPWTFTLAVAVACLVIGPVSLRPLFAAGAVVVTLLTGFEALVGMRAEQTMAKARRGAPAVLSLGSIATRVLRSHSGWTAVTIFGSSAVAALTALTAVAVREGWLRAGTTRLSAVALDATSSLTIGLGALGIASAGMLLLLARQADNSHNAAAAHVFTNLGYRPATQAVITRRQELLLAAGSLVVGAPAVAVIAIALDGGPIAWLSGTGGLAIAIAARLLGNRRRTQRPKP